MRVYDIGQKYDAPGVPVLGKFAKTCRFKGIATLSKHFTTCLA